MTINKGGRPQKDDADKQSCRVTANFTPSHYKFIERQAKRAGVRPNEYIRLAAIEAVIKERVSKEQMKILRELFGIGNNLNQAMHLANYYNQRDEADQVRRKLDDVLELINKVRMS